MTWRPSLGAWVETGGVRFRTWAPEMRQVALQLEPGGERIAMERDANGYWTAHVPDLAAGARYRYVLDGQGPFPDPASRFQPEGVHGPSEVIDPSRFVWSDADWNGVPLERLVTYELHIGTLTAGGTFAAAVEVLPELVELGVTAIQLMPVSAFPGQRNWGYDGVQPFAPARAYGTPDDLRALVDQAHRHGLGVILDVVYNHFGPDGAYQGAFSPHYFSDRHSSPWGQGINLDGPHSGEVRHYFIESALHWLHEHRVDGFRLDATHALIDDSPVHFLAEYAAALHENGPGRHPLVIVEDHRNLAELLHPPSEGGYGLDAVLADDFHHEVRRLLAGDDEGYYEDYQGTTEQTALSMRQGWTFTGEHSRFFDEPRGTDPSGIPLQRFIHCIQNHDQVGNRPFGDRLHHEIDLDAYRAASALLVLGAATPMLFQGQEWATSAPFQFFTDHHDELGRLVTEGRRREFRAWSAFSDPERREQIPDPQAPDTFERSRLRRDERDREPHAGVERLYRDLLRLRRSHPALDPVRRAAFEADALDEDTVALHHRAGEDAVLALVRLRGEGEVAIPSDPPSGDWKVALTTEDEGYVTAPLPPRLDPALRHVVFQRPGAIVLTAPSHWP